MHSLQQRNNDEDDNNNNNLDNNSNNDVHSSIFCWVQLYYKEKEEPEGRVFKIKPVPDDVDALAKEVKEERRNTLSHCDATDLSVYSPGTKPPFAQGNSIKPARNWKS
ncbi:hypothetical protein IV203_002107 [Nitzschia inconspicua]|uniref:Uncharacterized protein n=1 Tax=Nitzschia inconspicua TaxID=303405 RepID=A0A9K3PUB4_9STRA|nr:hypothetical protein IV203_002107 [Nitzschia inconspicua]